MTRLILAFLIAVGMAAASGPAFAARSADCPMAASPSDMPMDHDEMGCCTPACAVTCPPAVLPSAGIDVPDSEQASAPAAMPVATALPSISPAATDPPPRTIVS